MNDTSTQSVFGRKDIDVRHGICFSFVFHFLDPGGIKEKNRYFCIGNKSRVLLFKIVGNQFCYFVFLYLGF